MPDLSGWQAAERLRDRYPGIRIVILTMHRCRAYPAPVAQSRYNACLRARINAENAR